MRSGTAGGTGGTAALDTSASSELVAVAMVLLRSVGVFDGPARDATSNRGLQRSGARTSCDVTKGSTPDIRDTQDLCYADGL